MDFDLTERQAFYRDRVRDFIETRIRPRHSDYKAQLAEGDRWQPIPVIEELKPVAREAGLWNLFMPPGRVHFGHDSTVKTGADPPFLAAMSDREEEADRSDGL